ncbi:tetratricopeptide repeat protein [Anabaena sp. PCC 7108]|uniref:tetratricopeptide repeat protein n=1 Tax=Anabaena sp. PCC 7108 TaxID=163908 RepID=UPI00034CBCA9|nr:tetratricopeptide repeat protein [Anabaena sp. PCC 7108]
MLTPLIDQYEKELHLLEESTELSEEAILQVFLVRDRIQKLLSDKTDVSADILLDLFKLDSRLKKQANRINQKAQLVTWRSSLEIPVNYWWWFLKPESHRFDKNDWLWNSLTIASLTASLSLVVDISTRFLGGGVGFGSALGTIFPSVLTLFTAGGVLTATGKIVIEKLLSKMLIPAYFLAEAKLVISLLLVGFLVAIKVGLPSIAENWYIQPAYQDYKNDDWDSAISKYEKAISLDPDNAQAHNQLGFIYEQLQDLEKARSEYKLAVQGKILIAYNRLARLYLLEKKPNEAISLLYILESLIEKTKNDKNSDKSLLQYQFYKNLGWTRFQQGNTEDDKKMIRSAKRRYQEAKTSLNNAISNSGLPENEQEGTADCLMAQVLEKLKETETSKKYWNLCLDANKRLPEVDGWKFIARERLTTNKGEK